ncbi:MAG: helix-turn-helix domain-containing protein [Acidimicrobiales bacterium]
MARRHCVATLLLPGTTHFEFAVTCEVFGVDRSALVPSWYRFKLCAAEPGPIALGDGYSITTEYGLRDAARADTIIVAPTSLDTYPDDVLEMLARAHRRGARLVSLCTGAFVLAAAGVLDDRCATTHWRYTDELARRYPLVNIDPNVLYVDDGNILTSAGTAASIDLCLHLVRNDFGAEVANAIARGMVVPPHRDGGQAQYVNHLVAEQPGADWLDETLAWLERNLNEPITVDDLAARSAMSQRTFTRRFRAATGTTPHAWLTAQRVQLAQRLLETTDRSIEWIADESGFGSAANLRLHFQRVVRTSPMLYRRLFQVQGSA